MMFYIDKMIKDRGEAILTIDEIESMSIEEYEEMIENIYNDVLDDMYRKDDTFKFVDKKKTIREYTIATALIQLIFWRHNVKYTFPIDEDDFRDCDGISTEVHYYIEDILRKLEMKLVKKVDDYIDILSDVASYIIEQLCMKCERFSIIFNNVLSLYDILQLADRNCEFNSILYTDLDLTMSVKDIENELKSIEKRLVDIIMDDGHNSLYHYVNSGILNIIQLRQTFGVIGTRANIDKTIYPVVINTNYARGVKDVKEFYAEVISSRDALITKKNNVGSSGYLSKKTDLCCLDMEIDYNIEDCGTPNYLLFKVKSEYELKSINNKYMILDNGKLHQVSSRKDKYLIGNEIKLRSHICCGLNESKRVCPTCFGFAANALRRTRIGGLPAIKIMNVVSKMSIGAKHFLVTKTKDIGGGKLDKMFSVVGNSCYLKFDNNQDYSSKKIRIDKYLLEELLDHSKDLDIDSEEDIYLNNVTVVEEVYDEETDETTTEEYVIDDDSLFLTLSNDLLSDHKSYIDIPHDSEFAYIELKNVGQDTPVFDIVLISAEMSHYLRRITKLLEGAEIKQRNDENGGYNALLEDILDFIRDSGLKLNIINVETIIHTLIRSRDDIERPDFMIPNVPYGMMTIGESITGTNIYKAWCYEDLKKIFTNMNSYTRDKSSVYDVYFNTSPQFRIPIPLKKY